MFQYISEYSRYTVAIYLEQISIRPYLGLIKINHQLVSSIEEYQKIFTLA